MQGSIAALVSFWSGEIKLSYLSHADVCKRNGETSMEGSLSKITGALLRVCNLMVLTPRGQ